jgi:hypothetical protein
MYVCIYIYVYVYIYIPVTTTRHTQDRYLECVVERIYYVNNRACNDKLTQHDISLRSNVEAKETYYIGERDLVCSDKLTQHDISLSNLVRVLKYVDEENDINKVLDYFSATSTFFFSYKHFFFFDSAGIYYVYICSMCKDINKVLDYCSYEHCCVLYCKFWELDNIDFCMYIHIYSI